MTGFLRYILKDQLNQFFLTVFKTFSSTTTAYLARSAAIHSFRGIPGNRQLPTRGHRCNLPDCSSGSFPQQKRKDILQKE